MIVRRARLRDVRSYAAAELEPGAGLTIVHGANGSGKTNLLEALFFGLTGRSCRTGNERELVRLGAADARVEVELLAEDGRRHDVTVGFRPGEPKRLTADGASVERLTDVQARPLVSVFLPDRLELVKGPPALRRAHVDQVVAATWPARAATRRAYGAALAQRNALIGRIRAGRASRASLPAWDLELARHAVALREDRIAVVERLREPFAATALDLGLAGQATVRLRPNASEPTPEALAQALTDRVDSDLQRGFTGHGPHRDDLVLARDGRELRAFGSQGEQRLALLALLLAERDVLAAARDAVPLLLLDDVMSELDAARRERLAQRVSGSGQCLLTTTELDHVPGASDAGVVRVAVGHGRLLRDVPAVDAAFERVG